jgi:glycosyltransferase involved in cell wall biosynthesis
MKEKILYIYPEKSSFIQKDIKFLSGKYEIITPGHDWKNKNSTPLNFLKQFFFLCRYFPSSKAVFVMFGGYWSFLPALFGKIARKPVYIIPGGTDCVSFPSLNYGSLRKPLMRTFIRWSFGLCTKLIPVDESLIWSEYSYYEKSDYRYQGYRFFFPRIKTPAQVIHNGFDPLFFKAGAGGRRHNSFIAVAPVSNMTRFRIKGTDLVLWLASQYSECTFTLIGVSEEMAGSMGKITGNVTILPFLPQEQFTGHLAVTEFVLQLSVSEGFPNSLCEAMLCGCIPVGSSVGAIPAIIGDSGFIATSSDRQYLKERFDEILNTDDTVRKALSVKARNRITENYSIGLREKAFLELIESGR